MDADYIQARMATFEGVKRRYTVQEKYGEVFIDDYAHHPTAIKYVIEETRTRFPDRQIVAFFQPDRYSRGLTFAKEFAAAMDLADYPYFIDFPENAHPEPGIDIDVTEITQYIPRAKIVTTDEATTESLIKQYNHVVYLYMSSKDIYKFEEKMIAARGKLESA